MLDQFQKYNLQEKKKNNSFVKILLKGVNQNKSSCRNILQVCLLER